MDITALDALRKRVKRTYRRLSDAYFRFFLTITERSPSFLVRDERGFGIGVWILVGMVAMLTGMLLIMMGAIEYIVQKIAAGVHLTAILTYVPQIRIEGMMFGSMWPGENFPSFLSAAQGAGGSLYSTFQLLSVVVLTVGFMLIGLSYVLEQFNAMRRGTSEKLLSESVLIIVLIFIFPYFYNASATALNAVDQKMILSPKVPENATAYEGDDSTSGVRGEQIGPEELTSNIATAAGSVPTGIASAIDIGGLSLSNVEEDPSRVIVAMVTMTASFMAVMIAFATGVFKVIATIALAAAFPLILSMRLIPFLRDVSSRLMSSLIGLMLASLVIALFFRVGWEILVVTWESLTFRWAIGVALLIAAAGAFTITAPAMSGMSAEISGTLGRSTAANIGGMVAGGMTTGMGAAAGVTGAGAMAFRGGAGKAGMASAMGRGGLTGLAAGIGDRSITGSITKGAASGKARGLEQLAGHPGAAGQHGETAGVMGDRLTNEFKTQSGKSPGNLSKEDMKAGRHYRHAIMNNNVNPRDSYGAYGKAREVVNPEERGKWTPTRIRAMEEKGKITDGEINEATKDAIADVKDLGEWEDTHDQKAALDAAIGKVMKGKEPGE